MLNLETPQAARTEEKVSEAAGEYGAGPLELAPGDQIVYANTVFHSECQSCSGG